MPVPFKLPRFYPILDTSVLMARGCTILDTAKSLIEAGVRILQYRHKDNWTQAHYDEAAALRTLCHDTGVLFVLNDRADFAHLLGAALHIGQNDLNPVAARKIMSDEVMGFSTHNRRQLARADEEPVEYLSLGPIFPTTSKLKPDPVLGIDAFRALRPLTTKPLVAIGGVTLDNAKQVFDAGADSVAIISGILPEGGDRHAIKRRAEEWLKL
ncbi:MAG: thiamine phosphate synthase [Acidobacteriota bacterium]|nr:thiamine phosphate synthase [Acidobacteriota bacterium]